MNVSQRWMVALVGMIRIVPTYLMLMTDRDLLSYASSTMLLEVSITATHTDSIYVYSPGLLHFQYQFTVELVVRIVLAATTGLFNMSTTSREYISLTVDNNSKGSPCRSSIFSLDWQKNWSVEVVICDVLCAFCTSTENDITHDSISIRKKNCRIGIVDFICVAPSSVAAFCGTCCTDSSTQRPAGDGRVKNHNSKQPTKSNCDKV